MRDPHVSGSEAPVHGGPSPRRMGAHVVRRSANVAITQVAGDRAAVRRMGRPGSGWRKRLAAYSAALACASARRQRRGAAAAARQRQRR